MSADLAEVLGPDGVIRHYVRGGNSRTEEWLLPMMLDQAAELGRTATGPLRFAGHADRPFPGDEGRVLSWAVYELPTEPGVLPELPPCPMGPYVMPWEHP